MRSIFLTHAVFFITYSLFSQIGYKKTFELCDEHIVGVNIHPLEKGELIVSRQLRGACLNFLKLDEDGNEIQNVEYLLKDSFRTAFDYQGSIVDKFGDLVLAMPYIKVYTVDTFFYDIRLSKIDTATLKEKWVRHYQTKGASEAKMVIQETEEGYRLMLQKSYPYWNGQVWFSDEIYMSFEEFDYAGNPLQKAEISPVGESYNWSTCFTETVNGNTVVAYNAGPRSTVQSQFISLVDSNYNVTWTKDISARILDQPPSVTLSIDKKLIYATGYKLERNILGLDRSGSGKIYTYDFAGSLKREQSLLTIEGGYVIEIIRTLNNGQIACAGWENAKHGRMTLINPDGTVVWDNRYKLDNIGGSTSVLYDIHESQDGSIIGIGNTSRPFEVNKLLVIKVDRANGCLDENCEELVNPAPTPTVTSNLDLKLTENDIQIYPNPNDGQFQILLPDNIKNYRLTISNISGKVVYRQNKFDSSIMPISLKTKGLHFLNLVDEKGKVFVEKVIVE